MTSSAPGAGPVVFSLPLKPLLFIHIGTHKTGSTAIQRALPVGGPALREGLVRLDFHGDISRAAWSQADEEAQVEKFRAQLQTRECRYLLSCEGFSGNPYQGYANAPVIAARLRAVTREFTPRIVVFLRRQDDFIESIYTQLIHQGGSQSFADFLAGLPPGGLDWHRLLGAYAAEFGGENLVVRRYHPDFYPKPESLLEDFCGIVGVTPAALEKKKAAATPNQGYSREAQEIALQCNAHLGEEDRRQLRALLQKISPKPVFQNYSYLDAEARRGILAGFEESNAAVLREYLPECGDARLFPPPEAVEGKAAVSVPLVVTLVKMLLDTQKRQRGSRLIRMASKLDHALKNIRTKAADR